MGKVVGVLRATHKLEDELNHQENGKNCFDLKVKKFNYKKFPAFCSVKQSSSTNVLQVSILIRDAVRVSNPDGKAAIW